MFNFRKTLSKKREITLLAQINNGDKKAEAELVEKMSPLIMNIADAYIKNDIGFSMRELEAIGLIGLQKAIEVYIKKDYISQKDFSFSPYATWWIRQAIHNKLGIKDSN